MTRSEHLAWCKERALEYVDRGDYPQAWTSMVSDMEKHSAIQLGTQLLFAGHLSTDSQMRRFIEGFN